MCVDTVFHLYDHELWTRRLSSFFPFASLSGYKVTSSGLWISNNLFSGEYSIGMHYVNIIFCVNLLFFCASRRDAEREREGGVQEIWSVSEFLSYFWFDEITSVERENTSLNPVIIMSIVMSYCLMLRFVCETPFLFHDNSWFKHHNHHKLHYPEGLISSLFYFSILFISFWQNDLFWWWCDDSGWISLFWREREQLNYDLFLSHDSVVHTCNNFPNLNSKEKSDRYNHFLYYSQKRIKGESDNYARFYTISSTKRHVKRRREREVSNYNRSRGQSIVFKVSNKAWEKSDQDFLLKERERGRESEWVMLERISLINLIHVHSFKSLLLLNSLKIHFLLSFDGCLNHFFFPSFQLFFMQKMRCRLKMA